MDKSGRGVPGALRGALVERSAEANKMDMELPPPTRGRLASQALSPPPAAAQKKPNNVLSSAHSPSLEQEQSSERIIHSFLPSARHGDHSGVASALRNPLVDPNMTDEVGNTALLTTCLLKRVAVVKLLLADKRVDPNIANKGGNTALSFVARHGSLSVLKLLLAEDRTIRTRPGHGGENYDAALAWLNRQGTDADAAPEEFLPAARDGDDSTVASALRNPLVNPNMTIVDDHDDDDDGDSSGSNIRSNTTALMLSASAGHISVMKLLLADGRVDINRTDPGGDSALMHATIKGRDAAVELLLGDEQLDPNKTNHFGMSPLLEAAHRRQFHALRLLLADRRTARTSHPSGWGGPIYNAALSWVDRQKSGADATAEELIVASEEGDAPTVASALRNPLVDPNMVDDAGWPPLINATIGNHAAVVALLVADQRVNPNLKNPKGDTALILAAIKGHDSVVKLLLADERLDPKIVDKNGITALQFASRLEHAAVAKLLLADHRVIPTRPFAVAPKKPKVVSAEEDSDNQTTNAHGGCAANPLTLTVPSENAMVLRRGVLVGKQLLPTNRRRLAPEKPPKKALMKVPGRIHGKIQVRAALTS